MNKNITSGYSGVKLLCETYTLESPRDPCRNWPDTPGGLIRRSHAILFAEGYTFVRIGHVRVESDGFMQTSIILRRRHRRLRWVFLIPPPPPPSLMRPFFKLPFHCTHEKIGVQMLCRRRQEARTYVLGVREPTNRRSSPSYEALSVLRLLKTRYGLVLSRRQDRRSLGRHAERRVSRFRSVPSQGTPLLHWLGRISRIVERGPPGTRRAPSAAVDSFGASVRTPSAYLLRTKEAKSLVSACEKYIHASTNFGGGETTVSSDRSNDRSLKPTGFGNGAIWTRTRLDTNREAVSKMPIERGRWADVKHFKRLFDWSITMEDNLKS